ncbi:MAG TPA: hypothetical protein VH298_01720 [Jatrophihabitans sp.]|nr:hypothetical protein [Jatrophihabitans sp.]
MAANAAPTAALLVTGHFSAWPVIEPSLPPLDVLLGWPVEPDGLALDGFAPVGLPVAPGDELPVTELLTAAESAGEPAVVRWWDEQADSSASRITAPAARVRPVTIIASP